MKTALSLAIASATLAGVSHAHSDSHDHPVVQAPQHVHAQDRTFAQSETGEKTLAQKYIQRRDSLVQRQLANAGSDSATTLTGKVAAANAEAVADNVLVLLVEFPDQKHTDVTADDTANFYPNFPVKHYEEMLFAEETYPGPQGQPLISVRSYLNQQSGGSYEFGGDVFGWYQASQPMAYYGANDDFGQDNDPRTLVLEALQQAINAEDFDMARYDQKDIFDLDGDGNLREPDGIIDHISVFHAAIDEAAGGPSEAIWSHRWVLDDFGPVALNEQVAAFTYTIQPIDAAAGVVAHEFGHDLGLPDEYDIEYSQDGQNGSPGSTVGNWSIMASGSYAGDIAGTEPVGYSPFAKQYLQATQGGNWLQGQQIHSNELTASPQNFTLEAATSKGELDDVLRIDLPKNVINTVDALGEQSFIATGKESFNGFALPIDLFGAQNATVNFKINADISADSSSFYASIYTSEGVEVVPVVIDGEANLQFAGSTNGWVEASIDLTNYVNDFVFVELSYEVFTSETGLGLALDEVQVSVDGALVEQFNADDETGLMAWTFGFDISKANPEFDHYYLLEWRAHTGVDEALKRTSAGVYAPGLVIWYVNTAYRPGEGQGDNATGRHPGEGWLSVVDANREIINLEVDFYDAITGEYHSTWVGAAESEHQVKDAAFNNLPHTVDAVSRQNVPWGDLVYNITREDKYNNGNPSFADWDDYSNYIRPATGTKLPQYGIVVQVLDQNETGEQATISVSKIW